MESYSYDTQLRALSIIVERLRRSNGEPLAFQMDERLALSLAECVKAARDHNTTCLPRLSMEDNVFERLSAFAKNWRQFDFLLDNGVVVTVEYHLVRGLFHCLDKAGTQTNLTLEQSLDVRREVDRRLTAAKQQ
jgi:hypothetical protein